MPGESTTELARDVRSLFLGASAAATDGDLLARFLDRDDRSEAAFAAIVDRHASTVWGACRRMLADPLDASEAFQATFLVLVRKAGSIRKRDSLGPWLYGVAVRVARRARIVANRRKSRERTNAEIPDRPVDPPEPLDDLRRVLDEELRRLPGRSPSATSTA